MMTIDDLSRHLPAGGCELDTLATVLLRCCREEVIALRHALDEPAVESLLQAGTRRAHALFTEIDDELFDDDDLEAVRALLADIEQTVRREYTSASAAVIAARAVAEGLERALGHRFFGLFRRRGRISPQPGDPVPRVYPDWKALFDTRLGTQPARREQPLSELTRLRLLPTNDRGLRTVLDFTAADRMATLDRQSHVGLLLPLSGPAALDWAAMSDGPRPTLFGVRPRRLRPYWRALRRLLQSATQQAAIVILPELSVDGPVLTLIQRWLDRHRPPGLTLLLAGSQHTYRDGRPRNVSTLLLPGVPPIEHYKFNPYEFPIRNADGEILMCREGIDTGDATVTVLMSDYLSVTVLICKDALETAALRLVEDLRVALVLVPALSEKTAIFETRLTALAADSQSIAVFCNLVDASHADAASMMITRPVMTGQQQILRRRSLKPPTQKRFSLSK